MAGGRPRAPEFLVNRVCGVNEVLNLVMNYREFVEETEDDDSALRLAARFGLLKNRMQCRNCNGRMTVTRWQERLDGKQWHCPHCHWRCSVRAGSFFERSHLSVRKILEIIYMWSQEFSIVQVETETRLSRVTVIDWYNFIRDICQQYVDLTAGKIGGHGCNGDEPNIVELDESKFFPCKYNRGAHRGAHDWVFGGVEWNSGRCFFVPVGMRDANTLMPLLVANVERDTQIITDGWAAYSGANGIFAQGQNYEHFVVVHDIGFVAD